MACLNNTLYKPSRNELEFRKDSSKPVRKKNLPYFIYHSWVVNKLVFLAQLKFKYNYAVR